MSFSKKTHLMYWYITNTGAPQGCVISPVLLILYTNDCQSDIASINPISKFADNNAILGLINNKNELSYRSEVFKFFSVVQHQPSSAKCK